MLEAFHFIRPLWLLALLPLGLLAWRLARRGGGDNPWQRTVDAALLPLLMVSGAGGGRPGMLRLVAAGWTIAALALAGPTWQRKPQPVYQTGAARVVVLDLSSSMMATDLKPSRLERARFKVEDVLALGNEGATGLVAYAGDAFAVAPLTRDANTVSALLKVLSPQLMPVQGSRADLGLLQAEKLMQQAGVSSGQVLLIADGVDPAHAAAANDAAARLREHGYRVSVLGVGTEQGAPVSNAQGQFLRDAAGKPVMANLDVAALQAVARAGGGQYQPVTDSGDALRALLDTAAQARVDTAQGKTGATASAWVDQGPWLVLLLLPLAALAFRRGALIGDARATATAPPRKPLSGRPVGPTLGGLMALGALGATVALWASPTPAQASTWDDAWQRPDQQAAAAMTAGDYAKAAQLATDAERRGSAEYKRGDYAQALANFAQASGARADYNRGNALAQLGRYADAVSAYDKTLGADPDNADAKANKAAVEALLRKQQQQQAQNQAGGGEPKDGKEQDKQQQSQQGQQAQQAQGQQQASNAKDGSSADKSGSTEAQQAAQGASKSQPGEAGKSASAAASAAQGQQAKASPSRREPKDGAAGQRGGEAGQDASAAQAQAAPASKPGDSFAEAARKLAAKDGTPKPDDAGVAQAGATAQGQVQADATAAAKAKAAGAAPGAQPIPTEEQLAAQQWLRRIPDDPGGLLRRKFLYQYQQRAREGGG